ncbi:MAG: type I-C CRISPR-associated protein Cas8c/Csd1, partial [Eubacteriales bacterium]|nr:type I-C CRISPR-associated protein Cas8c/Csd1 [Eubacteriales bacterium]
MSWLNELHETYDNCAGKIGQLDEKIRPLLPLYHTTLKAHIEITIDADGRFIRADVVDKNGADTIMPCTEGSAARTSKPTPHGLCDKLQYIARDYEKYGDKDPMFHEYVTQLSGWNASGFSHFMARAVYQYVNNNSVIQDLIDNKILFLDDAGKLMGKWEGPKETKPAIFSVVSNPEESVIRWRVSNKMTWMEKTLWESWINFQKSLQKEKSLCYITGETQPSATKHPKYIRNTGDGAKLISSNDTSNYTYRGRFLDAQQACSIGKDVSEKAHNALKWLISKQGWRYGDKVVLVWATGGQDIPDINWDTADMLGDLYEQGIADTAKDFADSFNKLISGYATTLDDRTDIILLILDSASPGRLSVLAYKRLSGSDFLQRVKHWHKTCWWRHEYKFKRPPFWGAPAPRDIAEAAYGRKCDDKLKAATVERLIPCIIDGRPLPADIVNSVVQRAKKRAALETAEFNKLLSIACALYKKYKESEGYTVALERDRKTRDYLYGRLLAVAKSIEGWALHESGENRITGAERLMQRFADNPFTTWKTIDLGLSPYRQKLGNRALKQHKEMLEIMDAFRADDFTDNRPLSGEF